MTGPGEVSTKSLSFNRIVTKWPFSAGSPTLPVLVAREPLPAPGTLLVSRPWT